MLVHNRPALDQRIEVRFASLRACDKLLSFEDLRVQRWSSPFRNRAILARQWIPQPKICPSHEFQHQ